MSKLNREQIIKALECCTYGGDKNKSQVEVCSPCPYFNEGNCTDVLKESALALIKELTEENERLRAENAQIIKEAVFSPMERANNTLAVRADTVRKMQERLKAQKFTHKNFGELVYVEDIDQIAKEMVEGTE